MYIIPDKYMEVRTCAECHKYLTVGPARKYPNGEIKCGRCILPDDGGRPQTMVFPKKGMFKCVNRFEGCRKIMTYGHVVNHETVCHSITLECLGCGQHLALYAMPKHFEARHKHLIMKTPSFSVKLTATDRLVFLYRLKDNLFFVQCIVHPFRSLELKTFFLGRTDVTPLFKYTVHFGDSPCKIETTPKPCLPHKAFGSNGFAFCVPVATAAYAFVQVHVDLQDSEVQLAKYAIISPQSRVRLPRSLRFSDANCSRLSVSPILTSLFMEDPKSTDLDDSTAEKIVSEYIMYCVLCWTTSRQYPSVFVENGPLTYQIICESCCDYLQKESPDHVMIKASELFPELRNANIEYSCVWQLYGCSHYFPHEYRDQHEADCPWQPPRLCPVEGCTFRGKLHNISTHFALNHPTQTVVLMKVPLMFDCCPNSNSNNYYMWAYYDFIWIEVAPVNSEEFQIRLPSRKQLENFCQPQPRVIINETFGEETYVLFDDNPVILPIGARVNVWCYFPEEE